MFSVIRAKSCGTYTSTVLLIMVPFLAQRKKRLRFLSQRSLKTGAGTPEVILYSLNVSSVIVEKILQKLHCISKGGTLKQAEIFSL